MLIYDLIVRIILGIYDSKMEYEIVSDYECCMDKTLLDDELEEIYTKVGYEEYFESVILKDFEWLVKYVELFLENKKYLCLLHLLKYLDSLLDGDKTSMLMDDGILRSLNTISCDKITLLPKIRRGTSWKYSNDDLSASINSQLDNVMVIFNVDLHGYNIINHYLDLEYEKGTFIVSGCPVSKDIKLNPIQHPDPVNQINQMKFDTHYPNAERLVEQYVNSIRIADRKKTVMLAFPELVATKEIIDLLLTKIRCIPLESVKIIALPTYYDNIGHNIGSVYYVEENRILFDQKKSFSYFKINKEPYGEKEYLNKNVDIHILHIKGIGRIAFPICKDLLVDKYASICRAMRVSLFIDRSFSPTEGGHIYFSRIIRGYTAFECCGLWINSCSYNNSDNDKVVCIVAKSKDEFNKEGTIQKCQNNCNQCIFSFTAN